MRRKYVIVKPLSNGCMHLVCAFRGPLPGGLILGSKEGHFLGAVNVQNPGEGSLARFGSRAASADPILQAGFCCAFLHKMAEKTWLKKN